MTKFQGEERKFTEKGRLKGLTRGHRFVSGPDLELVKVCSAVFTLFTSDCADGIRIRVNR